MRLGSRMTAAATTGPASGPRPASSQPATGNTPRFIAARSRRKLGRNGGSASGNRGAPSRSPRDLGPGLDLGLMVRSWPSRAGIARRDYVGFTATVRRSRRRLRLREQRLEVEPIGAHGERAVRVARPLRFRPVPIELDAVAIGITQVERFAHAVVARAEIGRA